MHIQDLDRLLSYNRLGRPWIALAHNTAGFEEAIIGTLTEGPSLYGDLTYLEMLPVGGPSTLKMG